MRTRRLPSHVLSVMAAGLLAAGCQHREAAVVTTPVPTVSGAAPTAKPQPPVKEVTEPFPSRSVESQSAPPSGAESSLATIYFDYDSSSLSADDRHRLEQDAAWLGAHPRARILIAGNCDERGTVEYNIALGDRRAAAARQYLIDLGIDASRIRTVSYGKERPADPGHDEAAWAKNRRDDFTKIDSGSASGNATAR